MAITAMGIGTKQAPENVNLDPQRQFWSWLSAFIHPDEKSADSYHHQRGYFHGFACTQTDPAGMSIQIGGTGSVDSALLAIGRGRCVLLSTDGEPEVVAIPTAPASGSRIDAVVSYIDTTSADPEGETPGTPEYVKTIVVSGTASSSPSAPTDAQIVSALPAGAGGVYYRWCDVRVAQGATTITNSNITDRKPTPPNVYWTTSEIEDAAAGAVNISASSGKGYMQFGKLLIQWGSHNFRNVPTDKDTTGSVTFTRRYASNPAVVVSCANWVAIRSVWSNGVTTRGFSCGVHHIQGSTVDVPVNWVAIGQAAS